MLVFEFMQRAFLAGAMLAIMIPLIGVVMVNRRTAMIGDALSHTSLAGVAIGLIGGFDPVIGAILICILSAFSIEGIRKRLPQFGDMATAVVMSIGLGLTAILANFAPGGNTFDSYLFGSISSVTKLDLKMTTIAFVVVVGFSIIHYSSLLDLAIDVNLSRLVGVNVKVVNNLFTILAAITIALSTRIVGALLVSSLMVLPVATALMVTRSYRTTLLTSVLLGLIYMVVGIIVSFYFDIRPGGAIVLNALIGMAIFGIIRKARNIQSPIQRIDM